MTGACIDALPKDSIFKECDTAPNGLVAKKYTSHKLKKGDDPVESDPMHPNVAHIAENVSVKVKDEKGSKCAVWPSEEKIRLDRGGMRSSEVVCILWACGSNSVEVSVTIPDVVADRACSAFGLSGVDTCLTVMNTRELPSDAVCWPPESGSGHSVSDCVGVISLIGEC